MDWIVKASAWDVAGFGEEDNSHFIALSGSSSLVGGKNGGGLLNDLGLGRLGDLQDISMDKIKEREGLTSLLLPSEMKKTHDISCLKKVLCLVDGCLSDLSKCREYHRRHRVCERHSKTPVVIIKGREQRFCQQCSRFHSLGEFDDVKRSCRKRLDGHNRRRRKPQQESLYMSSQNFLSDYRDPLYLWCNWACASSIFVVQLCRAPLVFTFPIYPFEKHTSSGCAPRAPLYLHYFFRYVIITLPNYHCKLRKCMRHSLKALWHRQSRKFSTKQLVNEKKQAEVWLWMIKETT